ncbi:MAG: hypothetical protein ABSD82_08745 [Solirubrobacteraceae bacterium]|jgi:hypothetical protein
MDEREELEQDHIEDLELAQDLDVPPEQLDGVLGGAEDAAMNKMKVALNQAAINDAYISQ